ncbi:hypothetical protein GCM10009605_32840 [Nocardiopsis composta]
MDATSRTPPASSSTLAVASPCVTPVTVAGILLRALSRMSPPENTPNENRPPCSIPEGGPRPGTYPAAHSANPVPPGASNRRLPGNRRAPHTVFPGRCIAAGAAAAPFPGLPFRHSPVSL